MAENSLKPSLVAPPTLVTGPVPQQMVAKLTDGLRHGMTLRQACDLAGAPYSEVKAWMTPSPDDPLPRVEFRRLLRQAMAEVAYNDLQAVSAATFGDWKAAAWRLSRMFKRQWGENTKPTSTTQISVDQSSHSVHGGQSLTQNSWTMVLQQHVTSGPTTSHDPASIAASDAVCERSEAPATDADPFAC